MADDKAIGRKELLVWVLGIGITLNSVQEVGNLWDLINLLRMESNSSMEGSYRYFSIRGEMLFKPQAIDVRKSIAEVNSPCVNGRFRQWSRVVVGALKIR